jgi:transcriptional regulator with XRE-family HTH domain
MSIAKKDIDKKPKWNDETMKRYDKFRKNLQLLRASTGLSADNLGKELGFKKHYRVSDLEYRRSAAPKLEEIESISKYFNIGIDQLLHSNASVGFDLNVLSHSTADKYQFSREILFQLRANNSIKDEVYLHWIDKLIKEEGNLMSEPLNEVIN